MDSDDVFSPILGRRQILRGAGALGFLSLARHISLPGGNRIAMPNDADLSDLIDDARVQAVCSITPGETEGPYYLNLNLLRTDITEGLPGIATRLLLNVVHASDCTPVPNAVVDVWHCDASGRYSGFAQQGTQGQTFLRGIQNTDANGMAYFDTIYPGWYPGRTTHVHLKVRPTQTTVLTTQMYFKQRLSNRIYGLAPYNAHGPTSTTNSQDGLYLPETLMNLYSVSPLLQLELTIGV
jgi:protocatechuate 3,4-dioxygenase beta subunit